MLCIHSLESLPEMKMAKSPIVTNLFREDSRTGGRRGTERTTLVSQWSKRGLGERRFEQF